MPLRRTLLIAASLFAALWCLMLISGGRLIVGDGLEPDDVARALWPQAVPVLPGAASTDFSGAQNIPARDTPPEHSREVRAHGEARGMLPAAGLARDANGNVLRAGPYMREAYRAFALEDAGG